MLPVNPKRLVIAQHRVDFRKQWNGLLAECMRMGFDPYAGDCVVFIKKDRTQMRALLGDALGLILVARRFDAGSLRLGWVFEKLTGHQSVSMAELALLFEGATCTITRHVPSWKS